MSRLFFLLAVGVLVYLLLRSLRKPSRDGQTSAAPDAEDMVRCAQCGVHLPRSESLLADGRIFCCEAHRRAFQETGSDS